MTPSQPPETPDPTDRRTDAEAPAAPAGKAPPPAPREHGGRDGPEPTRYGDWEKNGRCIDF